MIRPVHLPFMRTWLPYYAAAVAVIAACADSSGGSLDPTKELTGEVLKPTAQDVSGSYHATTFTTQQDSLVTNQLARGASLEVELTDSLTTRGKLMVPGGAEDGSDFAADLQGLWKLNGDSVLFDHPADTFIRDMIFVFAGDSLSGHDSFGSTVVRVVLTKR